MHAQELAEELTREAMTTKRLLEKLPDQHLAFRPHPKSFSLGQLALHVASTPGAVATMIAANSSEMPKFEFKQPVSQLEIVACHDQSIAKALACLKEWGDAGLEQDWTLMKGGRALISQPRGGMVRSLMLNHWYHHRGQLTVVMRLLDLPLPSVYGPSADSNPFLG